MACTQPSEAGGGRAVLQTSPLLQIIAGAPCSQLEPAAFFVSWHGVLTLAYK